MESIQGFLLINIYAFLIILSTGIVFFSKKRLKQMEDKLYKSFLLANIYMSLSGLILGILVTPLFNHIEILISIFNKIYLICLMLWILILTFYIFYISLKNKNNLNKYLKIFKIIIVVCNVLIVLLPIKVEISDNGVATSTGASIIFSYEAFAIGFIVQIICLLSNYKNLNSKKYIPLYLLILLGSVVLLAQMIIPSLNYIINPALILIAFIMYFTIENPDVKMIEEIHKAKEVTDTANEEKTMFLYNMTNELREITRDIDMEADNILNETDNKKVNIENVNNSAREIKSSTARFTTMTNEILDISAVDATSIKVYNDKYNIKLLIKELVQVYKKASEKKGIDFRTSIASDLPEYLYGDIVGLKNSLSTILDNSIEFTESGYIELSVNAIIKNDIARLIITVEDSGVGMKADELNKIFNKKSEDKEVTDLNENLYNARKLITLMGGTIIPSSVFGKGTTMKVVIDQKVFNSESDLTKYEKIYDKKRILLVDDSPAGVKIVTKMLNDTNIDLDVVTSGKECLDKIRAKEKYDLILLDEEMNPINGIEVMVKLKEIRNFNIKTILLTKNNDYEYNEEYLKYGFKDYLLKPLDKDKVFEKIDKYLK